MKNRALKQRLQDRAAGKSGRLTVLTGARQTGKTTLAREAFPDRPYVSLDDPVLRPSYTRLAATDWIERLPVALLDEVQKAPSLFDSLKAAYEASPHVRYVLLGSSQILLLSKVRESLAGRVAIEELWPLTLPELDTDGWDDPVRDSRLLTWLGERAGDFGRLLGVPAASARHARAAAAFERYLAWGGMPAVHDPDLTDDERRDWLADYQRTYLQRDVADLAALRDLEPFVLAQNALALRTGRLVNLADLGRTASISPHTAGRFLRYLELSYQVLALPPFHRNAEKRLAKMPKVHVLDPGVGRAITGHWGPLTGEELESAVVAEIVKQVRSAGRRWPFFHLRTHDGREVDLLIELDAGFVAIEVKQTAHVSSSDARHLRGLDAFLDRPLLGALVLSMDPDVRELAPRILAAPAAWALGTESDARSEAHPGR
jgi:predicted AAA+ superfamily ATPase